MPREKGRKGTNGGRNLETLVKLAAPAIGTAAGAFTVVGIIYLGMTLAGLLRGGGGEIRKAVAIIVAGLTCIASPTPKPNAIRRPRRCTNEAPRSVAQGLQ